MKKSKALLLLKEGNALLIDEYLLSAILIIEEQNP
jgi:hypothetical protein